jgi:hypothetical protein
MVYMDDVMVFSKSPEEHLKHLSLVLQALKKYQFFIRLSKCTFGRLELEFLGHLLSGKGIKPSPGKVKVISEWQRPINLQELRIFLGFTNYYRKFVPNFSRIALPLNNLTKKDVEYRWTDKCQEAFLTLRQALMADPVLVLPRTGPDAQFVLSTDSSGFALGAVLLQDHGKGLQHVEYWARSMCNDERRYHVHEQELLAVIMALRHWRHYLEGCKHFLVVTDHSTLKHFLTQPNLSRRQVGWLADISQYATNMDIFYRRGETNQSDGLSRRPDLAKLTGVGDDELAELIHSTKQWDSRSTSTQLAQAMHISPSLHLAAITMVGTDDSLVAEIKAGYLADPRFATIPVGHKLDSQGLYMFDGRIAVPAIPSIKLRLLQHFHDDLGHFGVVRLEAHIRQFYSWPGMSRSIGLFCRSCHECQLVKHSNTQPSGLLSPMPVPKRPWDAVGMDFIVQLPNSNGYDAIITFTCLFSKQVHLVPTITKITAKQCAKLYLSAVHKLHGISKVFVCDRDSKFTSEFWGAFTVLMGTKLNMSTAYHAQTDGQAERTNQTVEQVLRSFCFQRHDTWADYLDSVEFCINMHQNSSTGFSPFQVVYGFQPNTVGTLIASEHPGSAEQLLADREAIHKLVTSNLVKAKEYQQHYANKRVRDVQLQVGDRVGIHSKGITMPGQPGKALRQRYIGPFKIIEKLSPLVYKLSLPPAHKLLHPVFHISRLRLWNDDLDNQSRVVTEATSGRYADQSKGEFVVDSILKAKVAPHPRYPIGDTLQFKVHWQGYTAAEDSWEPYVLLKKVEELGHFMNSHAYHKLTKSPAFIELSRRWPARIPRARDED